MIIVGIDPGSRKTGYAVLDISTTRRVVVAAIGVFDLYSKERLSLGARLEFLYLKASDLFKTYNPRFIALEKAVTFKNPSSSLKLSEARGVIRLAAHHCMQDAESRIIELSPTAIKKNATGLGLSGKSNVTKSMSMRFSCLPEKMSADAYDALAGAWTVYIQNKNQLFSTKFTTQDKGQDLS